MTDPTIVNQTIPLEGGLSPTLTQVNATEYVALNDDAFLVVYNGSGVSNVLTVIPLIGAGNEVTLPPNEEVIVGPFDVDIYGPLLEVHFPDTTDISIAALDHYRGACVGSDVTRWVTEPERLALSLDESTSLVVDVTSAENITLVITEALVRNATSSSSDTVTLATTETSRASPLSPETVTLKNVETLAAIAYVGSDEVVILKIVEL